MNTLISHATILPMTSEQDILIGDICITDDKISFIGPKAPESFRADQVINGRGYAVLPSFTNAHTHSSMVLMRNYKDSESGLQAWLQQVWAIEAKLNANDIRIASELSMAEMIKSGITAFADMYYNYDQTAKCAINVGMRADLGLTIIGDINAAKAGVNANLDKMLKLADNELVNVTIAQHAIYTVPADAYQYGAQVARANGLKMHTHVSETMTEVNDSIRNFGTTPVKYLQKIGFFDSKTYIAHCVHITDEEIQILKDYDTTLVHCPSSNSKLASGIARVRDWRNAGLSIAFGTDGASSNNNLNMMKEINLGCMLASVSTMDTQALRPYEALRMATYGGAKAIGLQDRIGTLEVGKKADLIMVDMRGVSNTPTNDIYSALVYSSTSEDIRNVFCNGRMLMKNRRLLTIDEAQVKRQTNAVWKDICKR